MTPPSPSKFTEEASSKYLGVSKNQSRSQCDQQSSTDYYSGSSKKPRRKRKKSSSEYSIDIHNDSLVDHSKDSYYTQFKQFLAFLGPAVLISVGYVDPGNWATDIEGGSRFGYALIWVLVMSNLIAIVLQTLSARLGLVTGKDLSQQCSNYFPFSVSCVLWFLAELAIAATDLAEVLGTAIGLNLLFGLPMIWGVVFTAFDTFIFLALQQFGHRVMESFILFLMSIICICFIVEVFIAKPVAKDVVKGLWPSLPPGSLSVATGILGATIMPHNLYLHSGLILTRRSNDKVLTRRYNWFALFDGLLSLNLALLVNASILIVSASAFYGKREITVIQQAYVMLQSMFGKGASIVFGLALVLAGQSSTITGTIAGQMVMEGFLKFKMRAWIRRMITRGVAIIPAAIVILIWGDLTGSSLLMWSQVVLSVQLPFAMVPLIRITSHKSMGEFANTWATWAVGWICVLVVVGLNVWLIVDSIQGMLTNMAVKVITIIFSVIFGLIFLFVVFCRIEPKEACFAYAPSAPSEPINVVYDDVPVMAADEAESNLERRPLMDDI